MFSMACISLCCYPTSHWSTFIKTQIAVDLESRNCRLYRSRSRSFCNRTLEQNLCNRTNRKQVVAWLTELLGEDQKKSHQSFHMFVNSQLGVFQEFWCEITYKRVRPEKIEFLPQCFHRCLLCRSIYNRFMNVFIHQW